MQCKTRSLTKWYFKLSNLYTNANYVLANSFLLPSTTDAEYKIDGYNAKISRELPIFITSEYVCSYFRFRMYTHVTCSSSLSVCAWCKANICLWSTLSNSLYGCLYWHICPYLFCLVCMYNLYMYICIYVIHCWNRCTDMFYNLC